MRRLTLLFIVAFAVVGALAGQNPPTVVIRGSCPTDLPDYKQWFQQTGLPHGELYLAGEKRKQQIMTNYSKLRLRLSVAEVEEVMGKPDFASPRPAARLSSSPAPAVAGCTNQIAYVLKKNGENMADTEDVAIYLFFSADDRLYWAAAQNLSEMKPLGSAVQ